MARSRKTSRRRRATRRRRVKKQKGGSAEFLQGSGIPPVGSEGLQVSVGGVVLHEQELPLTDVQSQPVQTFSLEPNGFQSLMWMDPDAPAKSWLHEWIANRTSTDNGSVVVPWAPPSPPSGIHRQICVLFRQTTQISPEVPKRANFRVEEAMEKQGLTPIAATGMRVAAL